MSAAHEWVPPSTPPSTAHDDVRRIAQQNGYTLELDGHVRVWSRPSLTTLLRVTDGAHETAWYYGISLTRSDIERMRIVFKRLDER